MRKVFNESPIKVQKMCMDYLSKRGFKVFPVKNHSIIYYKSIKFNWIIALPLLILAPFTVGLSLIGLAGYIVWYYKKQPKQLFIKIDGVDQGSLVESPLEELLYDIEKKLLYKKPFS